MSTLKIEFLVILMQHFSRLTIFYWQILEFSLFFGMEDTLLQLHLKRVYHLVILHRLFFTQPLLQRILQPFHMGLEQLCQRLVHWREFSR